MIVFSHSKLSAAEKCLAYYRHKYLRKVYPRKRPTYYVEGDALHRFIERFYTTKGASIDLAVRAAVQAFDEVDRSPLTPDEMHDLRCRQAMVEGICPAYAKFYADDFVQYPAMMNELDCMREKGILLFKHNEMGDVYYEGKIDGLWQDKDGDWWILETKFLQSFSGSELDVTHIGSQTLGYMHLAQKTIGEWPKGILYNVITKPAIRLKKAENRDQFRDRVKQEYLVNAKNRQYFARYPIEVSKRHLARWLKETEHKAGVLATNQAIRSKMWPMSTSACLGRYGSPCEYLPACKDGNYNSLIYQKSTR